MIIVTGGAGFIGANIVYGLNQRGVDDILVVDNLENADKVKNLSRLSIADYMDKHEFYEFMAKGGEFSDVAAVFHEGACSDTMATDGRYVLHNNFTYSKLLLQFCIKHNAQYIYASSASVYGDGNTFKEAPEYESTLNAYAYSKLLFDNYVRKQPSLPIQCVGLRYFNVYGKMEQHKGRMASVAWHFRNQFEKDGQVKLFEGTGGYADGEQRRDFVSVEDVVKVNFHFLDHADVSGIYNVGTGVCQSFNDVALAVIGSRSSDNSPMTLQAAITDNMIGYIPMPHALHGKYQSFTEADLNNLRSTGYKENFLTVQQGVALYMEQLDRDL